MFKNAKQNKNLIIILLGIIIVATVLFTVYLPSQNNIHQITVQLANVSSQINMLESHIENIDRYEKTTQENIQYINDTLAYYPPYIVQEDIIMWLVDFENKSGAQIDTLNFSLPTELLSFNAYVNTQQGQVKTTMKANSIAASFSGSYAYSELKNSLDLIYSSSNRTSVDSVSISYNATTAQLTVNYNILKYYIEYPEAGYDDTLIYDVQTGVENPFRSSNT